MSIYEKLHLSAPSGRAGFFTSDVLNSAAIYCFARAWFNTRMISAGWLQERQRR